MRKENIWRASSNGVEEGGFGEKQGVFSDNWRLRYTSVQIMNYTVFHCAALHTPMKCINGHWSEWKYCATMQSSTSVQWAEMVCSGLGCFKFIALLSFHWLHYTVFIPVIVLHCIHSTDYIALFTLHCNAQNALHCLFVNCNALKNCSACTPPMKIPSVQLDSWTEF